MGRHSLSGVGTPEWSGRELFQEVQQLSSGRVQSTHLGTLQRQFRQMRARLLAIVEEPWPTEVIHGDFSAGGSPEPTSGEAQRDEPARSLQRSPAASAREQGVAKSGRSALRGRAPEQRLPRDTVGSIPDVRVKQPAEPSAQDALHAPLADLLSSPTLERAIQAYLQEQAAAGRCPKTLEWHRTALFSKQGSIIVDGLMGNADISLSLLFHVGPNTKQREMHILDVQGKKPGVLRTIRGSKHVVVSSKAQHPKTFVRIGSDPVSKRSFALIDQLSFELRANDHSIERNGAKSALCGILLLDLLDAPNLSIDQPDLDPMGVRSGVGQNVLDDSSGQFSCALVLLEDN